MNVLTTFVSSLLITIGAYRYAISRGVMDIPNERSSHTRPTPRGGGISFVITYSVYLIVAMLQHTVDRSLGLALLIGGLMIAIVGWIDDHRGLSPWLRLAVHMAAAAWAMLLAHPNQLDLGIVNLRGSVLASGAGVMIIAWFTNLFNFMDGIDGIASVEAISCGLAVWTLARMTGGSVMASLTLILASSVLGFLPMNWSPAKIFMGDAGSGFLGYVIGTLAVTSESHGGPSAWSWVVLSGVFVVDATLTLVRRILQGETWHKAHRSHVYQLAVQAGFSHRQVTVTVAVINLCLSVACVVMLDRGTAGLSTLAPLIILAGAHTLLQRRWNRQQAPDRASYGRSVGHVG